MSDITPKQVILVTGGTRGIGRGIVERIANHQRAVVINYRDSKEIAEDLVDDIRKKGGHALGIRADVADPAAVEEMAKQVLGEWGRIDAVVHNASPPVTHSRFEDTAWTEFERHWSVQVGGAFNLVKSFLPGLKTSRGQVVFVLSSSVLQHPPAQMSAYVTVKYGLMGLAKCLGVEFAKVGVRINMVSPYTTQTELQAGVSPRVFEMWADSHPMRRLTTVEDTAAAIDFLLSPDSSYVNLANIPITGGIVS
jgi:3-oxoacyl-[acyl-carrier protein] reductase